MPKTSMQGTINIDEAGGKHVGDIDVQMSTRFLEHFSKQLYKSPQKALEELITNGWDAGATFIDIFIPDELENEKAYIYVFDNGASMDDGGLHYLWQIADSNKANNPIQYGRTVVGKFGIGKLATYLLTKELTYFCKAADGKIRRITMDYSSVDGTTDNNSSIKFINNFSLPYYEIREDELLQFINKLPGGKKIKELISGDYKNTDEQDEDEFNSLPTTFTPPQGDTWTLVLLTNLKESGQSIKAHVLKRMLRAALPFGSNLTICLNSEPLRSSKIEKEVSDEWEIGPALKLDEIVIKKKKKISDYESDEKGDLEIIDPESDEGEVEEKYKVVARATPVPHIEIEGIPGIITGKLKLFKDEISTGKSESRGSSNGFHVNVLGRVVNQDDPSFGLENNSHATWARFRMAVRADGLNNQLLINRENFQQSKELEIFRAFLRKAFNKARTLYDSDYRASLGDQGDLLVRSLGVLSLHPLRSIVSNSLDHRPPVPALIEDIKEKDREQTKKEWKEKTTEDIRKSLNQIKYEKADDGSFVKYRVDESALVVNKNHPFVMEFSKTAKEKELLKQLSMIIFLADVYALDIGVEPNTLDDIRKYRDKLMRLRAVTTRESGLHIAQLLLEMQHHSNYKMLEAALSSALRNLGFTVDDMAASGEPEGLAKAYTLPSVQGSNDIPHPPLYTVGFDAKSTTHEKASTGNLTLDGIRDHRELFGADYSLVVAPDFQDGALARRAEQQKVTPMRAKDLAKLLEYTYEFGAIPLTKLREVFEIYDPNEITKWVENLKDWIKNIRPLTIDIFIKALEELKGKVPTSLPAATIGFICREKLNVPQIKDEDVLAVAKGLQALLPDLVAVENNNIFINVDSVRLAASIQMQLDGLHVLTE